MLSILGVLHAVPAQAREQLIPVDIAGPRLLCEATDTYCKVAVNLTHVFPPEMTRNLERIPVRCVARVSVRKEGERREQPMTFVRVREIPIVNATMAGGFEVGFDFPPRASSMQLDAVACTALMPA